MRNGRRHIPYVNPLQVAYQNTQEKLRKYNDLIDEAHEIYAAGVLLNPYLRKAYFTERWISDAAVYITPMLVKNKNIWENEYRQILSEELSKEFRSPFNIFIAGI